MGALIGIVMEAIRIRQRWKRLPRYVQFVRDYLISTGCNHKSSTPFLPPDVIEKTTEKYIEALRRLTQNWIEGRIL